MDCPYYEQLQYAGDTRVQALVSLYMTGAPRETSFVSTTASAASKPKTAERPLSFTSYDRVSSSNVIEPSSAVTASFTQRYVRPSCSSARRLTGGLSGREKVTDTSSPRAVAAARNSTARAAQEERGARRLTPGLWRFSGWPAAPWF